MHRYLTLSLLLSVMVLNACGTRGSLYLPPPAAQPPSADSPAVPADS
ncbi:MAG: lipoprotein [Candidatus Accumulibacter sp.]|nr:lipoprotein [Accumulibacter sp.]